VSFARNNLKVELSTPLAKRLLMAEEFHRDAPLDTTTAPVIEPGLTFASVTDKISSIVLKRKTPLGWFIGFAISFVLFQLLLLTITNLLFNGVGLWGVNQPVGWGLAILNFVWWIGIGHAGTLISAILLLLRQRWRTSINRFAEAMTLFAVAQAGLYPIFHLGRPWLAYWLFPYPNTMNIWPQFRSPLMWDVFAVSTYGTVSALFWFVGLIPDFATLRDRAKSKAFQIIYGMLAMGWRGSARHWHRYRVDRGLWLLDGNLLRLVQRQQIRTLHDLESHAWTIRAVLRGADSLQHHHAAVSVDQEGQGEPGAALVNLDCRQYGYVARALCNRSDEPTSRLFALVMGDVSADTMGLGHVRRLVGILLYVDIPVHSLPADDLDLRDADDLAGGGG
jgi:hypothetical protein